VPGGGGLPGVASIGATGTGNLARPAAIPRSVNPRPADAGVNQPPIEALTSASRAQGTGYEAMSRMVSA
jgi:hypothetical protein